MSLVNAGRSHITAKCSRLVFGRSISAGKKRIVGCHVGVICSRTWRQFKTTNHVIALLCDCFSVRALVYIKKESYERPNYGREAVGSEMILRLGLSGNLTTFRDLPTLYSRFTLQVPLYASPASQNITTRNVHGECTNG